MTSPFVVSLAILAGICFYQTLTLFTVCWHKPDNKIHISFAAMSLLVGGFTLAQIFGYGAMNSADLVLYRRIDFSLAILIFTALAWFTHWYTAWHSTRLPWALTGSLSVLVVINHLLPHGVIYPQLPELKRLTLPWGEVVTALGVQEVSDWFLLAWLLIVAVYVFLFVASARQYRRGQQAEARMLMLSGGVFLLFVLSNNLVNADLVQFVQLAQFGFIALIVMMGSYLVLKERQGETTTQQLKQAERIAMLGSWQLELVNNQLSWSDEIYRIFEIDPKSFGASYEAFLNAIHPEDRDKVNRAYTDSVANRKPYQIEHRLLMPDGRIKYVREQGETEYAADGAPLRSIGTVQDITAQVLVQATLSETTNFLNSIVEHIPHMIFIKRADDLRFVLWNKAGEELMGYTRAEMLGKNDYDFFAREQADFFTAKDREVLQRAGFLDISQEVINTRHLGQRILHTQKIALRDEQGAPNYLLGISEDITARIHAQQSLEASHRLLDAVVENAHVLIAVLDPDMNFIRVNAAYAETEGKTPDFFIGKNHFALYPHADNEVRFRNAVQSGEAITVFAKSFEYANNPERGVTHWDWTLTPIKDSQGQVNSLVLALLDVSERIYAIEALSQRERELHEINESLEARVLARTGELTAAYTFTDAVLQTVRVLIVVLNRHGEIVRFNRACEEVTGYPREEVIGKQLWDYLIPPEGLAVVKQVFANLTASIFPNRYENEWLMRDGSRRLFAWSNTCLVDAQGAVDFVIATGIDITESRRAERDLRDSEGLFRELTENIREVFFVRDVQTDRMMYVSPAYESLFDQSREELLRDPMAFLGAVHPDDLPAVRAAMQAQQERGAYFNAEFRIVRQGRDVHWIRTRTFPIYDDAGQVYRIAGLVEDITDRKLGEDQRLQHERAQRNALVREVHHRIKNNLQGVIGLLNQYVSRSPELQEPIESAITRVSTVALVHGLHSRDHQERILLCEMTEAIAANVGYLTGFTPQVRRDIFQPVRVLEEEAVAIALMLNELMFNAIKHADKPGAEAPQVVICLEDGQAVLRMRNRGRALPVGLDVARGIGLGTGLSLVRALLPPLASVRLHQPEAGWIETEVRLSPPAIELPPQN